MSYLTNTEFYFEVAKGNIAGHSAVNKFGHSAATVAGDDVWGGVSPYTFFPAAAVLVDIVSTSANDNGTATSGALTVLVQGLDENWNYVEELVTLNGLVPVTTMTTTFIRLFRAFVVTAGATEGNEGDITVYNRGVPSQIGIFIELGGGQTQQTIYTIPADKTAYFVKGYVGLATPVKTAENGVFQWRMKGNAAGPGGAWLTQGEVGLANLGSSHWQYAYGIPAGPIPEKTDIRIVLSASSAPSGGFDCVGGYDLVLVDN